MNQREGLIYNELSNEYFSDNISSKTYEMKKDEKYDNKITTISFN